MNSRFTESVVEDATLGWLADLGYEVRYGPDLAVGMPGAERSDPLMSLSCGTSRQLPSECCRVACVKSDRFFSR
jgi:hypothetical protein